MGALLLRLWARKATHAPNALLDAYKTRLTPPVAAMNTTVRNKKGILRSSAPAPRAIQALTKDVQRIACFTIELAG
jgi:hypothetical protein